MHPLSRDQSLDRLKGIAVILMIACHGCLYLFDLERNETTLYPTAILLLSLYCGPAFLYCYSYACSIERPAGRILRRFGTIAAGTIAFEAILLTLTQPPYAYHILFDFLIATLAIPLIIRMKPEHIMWAAFAIPALHLTHEAWETFHPAISFSLLHAAVFSYTYESDAILRTVHFPLVPFFAFVFLGAAIRRSKDALGASRSAIWLGITFSILAVLIEAILAQKSGQPSLPGISAARIYILMAIIPAIHMTAQKPWFLAIDRIILPMGRHVLPIYIGHHIPIFLLAAGTGWAVQYGHMMDQHMTFSADPMIWTATIVALLIFGYGMARSLDRINTLRRIRRLEAESGVNLT